MQPDGQTLREHYAGFAERTGRTVAEIAGIPELPDDVLPLWRDFMALHSSRNMAGMGPGRISWADIDAYQRVHRFRFEAWELDAIRRADTAFMVEAGKRKPKG